MAELVDALDSDSSEETRGGSSPLGRTNKLLKFYEKTHYIFNLIYVVNC